MDRWDEMRTAYTVARLGTVSAAAAHMGIHRATVVRHIDVLEAALGGKLFQRHARGYTPTEAGQDLLRVARTTEEQFQQLAGRTRGRSADVSGELVVTSVEVIAPLILPALRQFHQRYPDTQVRYDVSGRMYQLEYGEAHVAIRSGEKPQQPDNVVQPFLVLRSGLFAHQDYLDRYGSPQSPSEYGNHNFILDLRAPLNQWMMDLIPTERVVFSCKNERIAYQALLQGMGIGFYPTRLAAMRPELVEVHPPHPDWDIVFWLVTHIDLHRTPKVQAILRLLKPLAKDPG